MLADRIEEGNAALLIRLRSEYTSYHRCSRCSGDRLRDEPVDAPFCPHCGYLLDLHDRVSECPSELEVRPMWGDK